MAEGGMTPEARRENRLALMQMAGIEPEQAEERLNCQILLTAAADDPMAENLAQEVSSILSRTLHASRMIEVGVAYAAEIVIGVSTPRLDGLTIHVALDADGCNIGPDPANEAFVSCHPLLGLIAACYVCGVVVRKTVCPDIDNPPRDPVRIDFEELGIDCDLLAETIDIGTTYLAGAGAIGNGFLWAARHLDIRGELHVVDDDFVSSGNLQRQVWFDVDDVEKTKVDQLVAKAQPSFPNLRLVPRQSLLQDLPERSGSWLKRLIVGVDSRAARRSLQNEFPAQVFDASTTGSVEIVLHKNDILNDLACLGCVYPKDQREVSEREARAEHLGISVEEMASGRITAEVARKIVEKHPQRHVKEIEGEAFDSLYKALCSAQELKSDAGRTVVAPFAFVSVLAGAYLALDMVHRLNGKEKPEAYTNEWRINPWHPPFGFNRYRRTKLEGCECCGRPALQMVAERLWSIAKDS